MAQLSSALPLLVLLAIPASVSCASPAGLRGPKSPRRLSDASWMPPRPSDLACLQPKAEGCFRLRDRNACLSSKDGRPQAEWNGLKVHGEPCTWCGGGHCHNNNTNLCEPYDFLRHGLGVGFHAFLSTQSYEVAHCSEGLPLLTPWATASKAISLAETPAGASGSVANDALADIPECSAHPACALLGLSGSCCPSSTGEDLACCNQKPSENVAPMEGVELSASAQEWWQTPQPKSAAETSCLMNHRYGCDVIKHEETCLGSVDGRSNATIDGLKVQGQPCVWCGGVPCHSKSTSLCEPLDYLMRGEGKSFTTFYAKATYQAATCVDGKPAPAQKIFRHMPLPAMPSPPPVLKIDDSWWKTDPLAPEETSCLMEHRYGCNVIRHQETCLGSKDFRDVEEIDGIKIKGQPCVWCGGLACTSRNATSCEPLDLLMNGEGKAFGTFLAKATYQVARCKGGMPMDAESIFRHVPIPPVPTLAPWWLSPPVAKETMDCLTPLPQGCMAVKSMGQCLTGRDAGPDSMISGLALSGQPCIWCGGGLCMSNSTALCAPYDYAVRGEGTAFDYFYPKTTYRVANCLERKVELPEHDFQCLADAAEGCAALQDAASCLSSRDGQDEEQKDGGLKVKGQPCVWCGGMPCTSANANKCEPFDWVMNGKGQAFRHHVQEPTTFYRLAGCKNQKPAALNFLDYAQFVGGYVPPALEAAPLVPFWVANKPTAEATSCLKPAENGCNSLKTMEQCMTSKDGRSMKSFMDMQIAGEPCVWCGGIACTTNSSSLCEPFGYVMYGQGKAFTDFTAKGIYKVAGCEKGDIHLPAYDYSCLETSSTDGCSSIWNAEECLASKDGRAVASVGSLQVQNQPCVWCGGGACHSGKASMCEAFDYAVNGEGRVFARFHAQGTYRLAACKDGKPKAATLKNFTDFVPGYTFKPPPPPTVAPRERWWVGERPSEESTKCLTPQAKGCNSLFYMGACLSSSDGRNQATAFGDLKIQGEPCVWCGGGRCHSNETTYCEPLDYLMRGEGKAFDLFYTPHNFKVADCAEHIQLPDRDYGCLKSDNIGCDSIRDAATCLMSSDGRPAKMIDGMKVHGQPCVWCGGAPCSSGSAALCEPYDYIMNGEGKAFEHFHGKLVYSYAGCKDGFPAAMTYDGFVPYVQGYLHPGYNRPEKILPYWVPERPTDDEMSCLTEHPSGCEEINEMSTCLSSRDGRSVTALQGLKVNGEPCVWCNGGLCASGSKAKCMPFDYAMRGEGRAFATFFAKDAFRIAGCFTPHTKPSYDYSCLKPIATGCSAITNPFDCLAGTDGRADAMIDGLKVHGEPCVWCGGGLCHTGATTMCEPFDYVMNGAGRAFYNFNAQLTYRIAACQDGHPQGATLEGFKSFIPGAVPTVKPFWWITEPKPEGEELSCLMEHRFGCYVIKHKETCLGSKDGRSVKEWNGLKIHDEPCVWCGGMPCQTNSSNLCEPYDFLMHGEGKAFWRFTAKTSYNVARCHGGKPMQPTAAEATSKDLHFTAEASAPAAEAAAEGQSLSTQQSEGTAATTAAEAGEGDCWYECGEKGGNCPWCGPGRACCRDGWSENPAECAGAVYTGSEHHQCVAVVAGTQGAASDTSASDAVAAATATATSAAAGAAAAATNAAPAVDDTLMGKDCWYECGQKSGSCTWCGQGMACCREGWSDDRAECAGAKFTSDSHHECVAEAATAATPAAAATSATLPVASPTGTGTGTGTDTGIGEAASQATLAAKDAASSVAASTKDVAAAGADATKEAVAVTAGAAAGAAGAAAGAAGAVASLTLPPAPTLPPVGTSIADAASQASDAAANAAGAAQDAAAGAAGAATDAAAGAAEKATGAASTVASLTLPPMPTMPPVATLAPPASIAEAAGKASDAAASAAGAAQDAAAGAAGAAKDAAAAATEKATGAVSTVASLTLPPMPTIAPPAGIAEAAGKASDAAASAAGAAQDAAAGAAGAAQDTAAGVAGATKDAVAGATDTAKEAAAGAAGAVAGAAGAVASLTPTLPPLPTLAPPAGIADAASKVSDAAGAATDAAAGAAGATKEAVAGAAGTAKEAAEGAAGVAAGAAAGAAGAVSSLTLPPMPTVAPPAGVADAASQASDAASAAAGAAQDAAAGAAGATKDAVAGAAGTAKEAAEGAAGAAAGAAGTVASLTLPPPPTLAPPAGLDDLSKQTKDVAQGAADAAAGAASGASEAAGQAADTATSAGKEAAAAGAGAVAAGAAAVGAIASSLPSMAPLPTVTPPSLPEHPAPVTLPAVLPEMTGAGTTSVAPASGGEQTTVTVASPLTTGEDCWEACGKQPGDCPGFCGDGAACCKRGSLTDPAECSSVSWPALASLIHHQCVAKSPSDEGAFDLRTTLVPGMDSHDIQPGLPGIPTMQPAILPPTAQPQTAPEEISQRNQTNSSNTTVIAAGMVSSGIPSWVWVLLAVVLLVCIPLLVFFLCCGGPKKKKRSSKKSKKQDRAESMESNEDSFVTQSSEMEMQQPLVAKDRSVAVAPASQSQGQGGDLFDMIDRNHDGVISQGEFNRAMQTVVAAPARTVAAPVQHQVVPGVRVDPSTVMQTAMVRGAAPVVQRQPGVPGVVTISPYGANVQYR